MTETTVDTAAIRVLGQASEDAIRADLVDLASSLDGDAFLELMVKLLLQSNLDRDRLKQRVADLVAARYGKSSEKASDAQLALFAQLIQSMDGAPAATDPTPGADAETATETPNISALMARTESEIDALVAEQVRAKQLARERERLAKLEARQNGAQSDAWPTHLPVREVTRDVPEHAKNCDCCGAPRQIIRYAIAWRVEYITNAEVVVTKTPVVACGSHHGGPLAEPVEPKPVDKGRMGFTLAARILYWRYTQNLPIRRIVEMLTIENVPISEDMVHTLIRQTAMRAQPVLAALAEQVRTSQLVNLDDTPVQVLKKDGERHVHKGRIWVAIGDEQWAWFFATKNWKAEEAERRLGNVTGVIQGDGYKGYPAFAGRQGVALAGCWGHVRRKIRKAVQTKDPRAGPAMALIQGLYRVEKLAQLGNLGPEEIVALRQERSAPLVHALGRWAAEVAPSIVRDSPLGQAWTYLNNQWARLQVFLMDGRVSLTNDTAERGLRRITIGRKLWLFFHNNENVEWAAVLASLMATARLHGVNELDYITWLLRELARREWSPAAARSLLPDIWLASQQQQLQEGTGVEV